MNHYFNLLVIYCSKFVIIWNNHLKIYLRRCLPDGLWWRLYGSHCSQEVRRVFFMPHNIRTFDKPGIQRHQRLVDLLSRLKKQTVTEWKSIVLSKTYYATNDFSLFSNEAQFAFVSFHIRYFLALWWPPWV